MQDLATSLLINVPLPLRVAVGHYLPLMLALWCVWSLRKHWFTQSAVVWLFAVAAVGRITWETARLHLGVVNGVQVKGILFSIHYAVWFAVLAAGVAFVLKQRLPKAAVYSGVLLPLWLVDCLLVQKVFPGRPEMLFTAVGGAGPLDALNERSV